MTVRKYEEKDLTAMIQIWNEVVEDGIAFPQEELLTPESGKTFFAGQTLSCVAEETSSELFELQTVKPYPTDSYNNLIKIAKDEQNKKARPALKSDIDISAYDTIYIGYPNWWGDMPMPLTHSSKPTTGRERQSFLSAPTKEADLAEQKAESVQPAKAPL